MVYFSRSSNTVKKGQCKRKTAVYYGFSLKEIMYTMLVKINDLAEISHRFFKEKLVAFREDTGTI